MPPQGRLAYEIASRPLFAENLHAEAAVIEIIARGGEFCAAWGEVDAENYAADPHRPLARSCFYVPDPDGLIIRAAGNLFSIWAKRYRPNQTRVPLEPF